MAKKQAAPKQKLSTDLCFLLRHNLQAARLTLDRYGYAICSVDRGNRSA